MPVLIHPKDTANASSLTKRSDPTPEYEPELFEGAADPINLLHTGQRAAIDVGITGLRAYDYVEANRTNDTAFDAQGGRNKKTPEKPVEPKEYSEEEWDNLLLDTLKNQRKNYLPDPYTTGFGTQVLDSLGGVLGQFATVGPAATLATQATVAREDVLDATGDEEAANKVGLVTGATFALGFGTPAAIGKTAFSKIASGGVLNVGFGAGSDAANAKILRDAGHTEMADQYDAFDVQHRTADAILGAAFGFYHRPRTPKKSVPPLLEASPELDAAMVENLHRQAIDMHRDPIETPEVLDKHHKQFNENLDAATRGDELVTHDGDPQPVPEGEPPKVTEVKPETVEQPKVTKPEQDDVVAEFEDLRERLKTEGDFEVIDHDTGDTRLASDILKEHDQDMSDIQKIGKAIEDVITCFFKGGTLG